MSAKVTTLAQLRAEAERVGVTIIVDEAGTWCFVTKKGIEYMEPGDVVDRRNAMAWLAHQPERGK